MNTLAANGALDFTRESDGPIVRFLIEHVAPHAWIVVALLICWALLQVINFLLGLGKPKKK